MHNPNTNFNFGFNQSTSNNNTNNQQQQQTTNNTQKLNNFLQTQFYQNSPDLRDLQYRRTCFRDWDTKTAYINHIAAMPGLKNFTPKEIETMNICKLFLKGTEKENVGEYNRPWNTSTPYGGSSVYHPLNTNATNNSAFSGNSFSGNPLNTNTFNRPSGIFNNPAGQQMSGGNTGFGGQTSSFGNYGQTSTSSMFSNTGTGNSTGLFGKQSALASTFGNSSNQPSSIFGNSFSHTSSNQPMPLNQPMPSGQPMFGNSSNQPSSVFGNPPSSQSSFGNPSEQPSSTFGNAMPTSSIFGGTTTGQQSFGGTSSTNQPSSIFGSAQSNQPLFGNTSTNQPSSIFRGTSSSFGNPSTPSSFGNTPSNPQSSIFGNTSSAGQPFGNTSTNQPSTIFGGQLRGNTNQPSFGNAFSVPTSGFGQNTGQSSIFGSSPSNQSSFGNASNQPSSFAGTTPGFVNNTNSTTAPPVFGNSTTASPVFGNSGVFRNSSNDTVALRTNPQSTFINSTSLTPPFNPQQWNNNPQQQASFPTGLDKRQNTLPSPQSSRVWPSTTTDQVITETETPTESKPSLTESAQTAESAQSVDREQAGKEQLMEKETIEKEEMEEMEHLIIQQPRVDEYYFNDPKFYDFCHKTEIGKKLMEPGYLMFPIQPKQKKMKFELEIWPETKALMESEDFTKPQKKLKYENNKIIKGDVTFTETFLSEEQKAKLLTVKTEEFIETNLMEKEKPNIASEKDSLSLTEKGMRNDSEPEIQLFPNPAVFKGESLIYNAKVVFRNSLVIKYYDPISSKDFTVENVRKKIILDFIDSPLIKKLTSIKHIKIPTFKDPKNKGLNKSCFCKVFDVNPKNVFGTEKLDNQKDLSGFIRVKANLKKVLKKNFVKYEWTEIGGCLEMTID